MEQWEKQDGVGSDGQLRFLTGFCPVPQWDGDNMFLSRSGTVIAFVRGTGIVWCPCDKRQRSKAIDSLSS